MQTKWLVSLIALTPLMLVACNKSEQAAEKPVPAQMSAQQEALDKAKAVEGLLMEANGRQRQEIDNQSQ